MTLSLAIFVPLYLAFAVKHLVADYGLQFRWMALGKAGARNWIGPLAAHCAIHGILTLAIALVFAPSLWWLGIFDFGLHALIDRSKSRLTKDWTAAEHRFWIAFGVDQFLHQLTHFAYVVAITLAAAG